MGCGCDGYGCYVPPCTCNTTCYGFACSCDQTCYGYVSSLHYRVWIDGVGTPNTFKWSDDGGTTWVATLVPITGEWQDLNYQVKIKFDLNTGHTINDYWDFYAGEGIFIGERLIYYYKNYLGQDLAYHELHLGTAEQDVSSQLKFEIPEWNETMRNTAYSYFRLKYNADAWKALNDFTLVLKGKKIYDPRIGMTRFSRNPALVWLDLMVSSRYGLGIPMASIDLDSVCDVANWCDTNSYYFDGLILDRQSFGDHMEQIFMNFRAFTVWSQGIYYLKTFTDDASVMTLTEDDVSINPESFRISIPGIPETPNATKVTFADKEKFYTANFASYQDLTQTTYTGDANTFEMTLIGSTSMLQSKKIAKYALLRNKFNKEFTFPCHPRAFALEPGDMVLVTHSFPGWDEKKLRVKSVSNPQQGMVTITFMDEDSSIYDATIGD